MRLVLRILRTIGQPIEETNNMEKFKLGQRVTLKEECNDEYNALIAGEAYHVSDWCIKHEYWICPTFDPEDQLGEDGNWVKPEHLQLI